MRYTTIGLDGETGALLDELSAKKPNLKRVPKAEVIRQAIRALGGHAKLQTFAERAAFVLDILASDFAGNITPDQRKVINETLALAPKGIRRGQ